jgi:outer membrane lipoprotein SlyB
MRNVSTAAALAALALPACLVTTHQTRTWGEQPQAEWTRPGHVESIRENVQQVVGDPAGGAVAGAVIGGVIGHAIGGHHNPVATLFGAWTGAAVGANASRGYAEHRWYEVWVRFEDGTLQSFVYGDYSPFRVGDAVQLTPQGLQKM